MASYLINILQQGGSYVCHPPYLKATTGDVIIFHSTDLPLTVYFASGGECHMRRLHPPMAIFSLYPPYFKQQFNVGTGGTCKFDGYINQMPGQGVVPDVEIDINP